ncbi:MAG: ADP-ribosylglycohydrolase family protein [Leptolyngbyaceae cyanobacterium SL_7_1]|nr:ADP-ribosylglycohydrolase family protein [Leptolyngbyaceae cyanobacterium SL_7_1]
MNSMIDYSLTNRFMGGMVGAVLGECIGTWSRMHPPVTLRSLHHVAWTAPNSANLPLNWSLELVEGVTALLKPVPGDLARVIARIQLAPSVANRAIASLPLAFYLHNDSLLLRQSLEATLNPSTPSAQIEQTTIALLVDVVAALLRGDDPIQPIRYAIDNSELAQTCPALIYRLTQLYDLHTQKLGLAAAAQLSYEDDLPQLSRANLMSQETVVLINALAIALYGFLSSPEHFRLAIVRVAAFGYTPSLTCTLVGILSGVHNTMTDIPLVWRQFLRHTEGQVEQAPDLDQHLAVLSKQLTAVWSGVYCLDRTTPASPVVVSMSQSWQCLQHDRAL